MQKLLYIFIFFSRFIFSQTETVEISGRVSDPEDKTKPVFYCKVRLCFDSSFIETSCDTNGYYIFTLSKKLIKKYKIALYAYQDYQLIKKNHPPPIDCSYAYTGPNCYMNSGFFNLEFKQNIGIYKADLNMRILCNLQKFPCFNFKKNSLDLIKCDEFDPDTSLICLHYFLKHSPTIVIEIGGASYEEKQQQNLSYLRALKLKNKLIVLGIDSVRIKAIGYADTMPIHAKKEIQKAGKKKEKEQLKTKNRYAVFRILSWDYDTKLKKIINK